MKYIDKKKKQWEISKASNNIIINQKTKQPNLDKLQIDILKDKKTEIKDKIKNLGSQDFRRLETIKDGNCMFHAIL